MGEIDELNLSSLGDRAVVPYSATSKADPGHGWDGSGARRRLARWASSDGSGGKGKVDWSKYRQGFTWYDSADSENFGAYKLPHHDVVDGSLAAVWRGVAAAMSRVMQSGTDIPDGERRGCYNHLRKHYAQFDEECPPYDGESDNVEPVAGFLAEVRADVVAAPIDDVMLATAVAVINARYSRQPLTVDDIFLLPVQASNQNVDSYGTRMSAGTMRNYLEDARNGTPLMVNHRTGGMLSDGSLPIGRAWRAHLVGQGANEEPLVEPRPQGKDYRFDAASSATVRYRADEVFPVDGGLWINSDGTWQALQTELGPGSLTGRYGPGGAAGSTQLRLLIDHYILRHWTVDGQDTESYIRGIQAGVISDVSIGFRPRWYRCGLCGLDLHDPSCPHIPTLVYDEGEAFAWVEDGRLVETSIVYAGATPEAVIGKARSEARAGNISKLDLSGLEDRWQVRLLPKGVYMVSKPRKQARAVVEEVDDPDLAVEDGEEETLQPEQEGAEADAGEVRSEGNVVESTTEGGDSMPEVSFDVRLAQLFDELQIGMPSEGSPREWLSSLATDRDMYSSQALALSRELDKAQAEKARLEATVGQQLADVVGRSADDLTAAEERAGQLEAEFTVALDKVRAELDLARDTADELRSMIQELQPRAEIGDTYRSELIDEAVAWRVRAVGKVFDADTYRAMLEQLGVAYIKAERDAFQRAAEAVWTPGRQIDPGVPARVGAAGVSEPMNQDTPDHSFKV